MKTASANGTRHLRNVVTLQKGKIIVIRQMFGNRDTLIASTIGNFVRLITSKK